MSGTVEQWLKGGLKTYFYSLKHWTHVFTYWHLGHAQGAGEPFDYFFWEVQGPVQGGNSMSTSEDLFGTYFNKF